MEEINWTVLKTPERKRVYVFPGNEELVFENVAKVEVRSSGKHRIETVDGVKAFVNTGWLYMIIDTDEWTF